MGAFITQSGVVVGSPDGLHAVDVKENIATLVENGQIKYPQTVSEAVITEDGTLDESLGKINNNLADKGKSFKFGVDDNGNYGYYKDGADTVTPFRQGYEYVFQYVRYTGDYYYNFTTLDKDLNFKSYTYYANSGNVIRFEDDYISVRQYNGHGWEIINKKPCKKIIDGTNEIIEIPENTVLNNQFFYKESRFTYIFE